MNPDSSSKSAAKNSRFPCTFKDCDRGFAKSKDLKRHKKADHEWCEVCDLDFENDRALVDHKKEVTIAANTKDGGKHNACLVCGEDFMCVAGRVRHAKLVSSVHQSNMSHFTPKPSIQICINVTFMFS